MNDDNKRDALDYRRFVDTIDNAILTYDGDFRKIKYDEAALAPAKSQFEDIPIEAIQDYRAITSEENYWKNKLDDLNDACKILSAYDIDTDYTEIILRTREASREAKRLGDEARAIEKKYPNIPATLNIVFKDVDISHDPILDRRWRRKENKLFKYNNDFAKYLGGANAIAYTRSSSLAKAIWP